MPELWLVDEHGQDIQLDIVKGQRIVDALLGNHIPPTSVIVTADGDPVPETRRAEGGRRYEVRFLEGYDVNDMRELYESPSRGEAIYEKPRLVFGEAGNVTTRWHAYDGTGIQDFFEQSLADVITHYGLLSESDTVILGLSGGVDSSALLLAWNELRDEFPSADLVAVTVETPWESKDRSVLENAREIAAEAHVEHQLVEMAVVTDTYNLNRPVSEIIETIATTGPADYAGALFDSIISRMLESTAEKRGADSIWLGTHATEAVAGLLRARLFGFEVDELPRHVIDDLEYIHPLTFLSKKDITHYYHSHTGRFSERSAYDPWQLYPMDQRLYSYVADMLRYYWPGIEYWFVEGANSESPQRSREEPEYSTCWNCGTTKRVEDLTDDSDSVCQICSFLAEQGYVDA